MKKKEVSKSKSIGILPVRIKQKTLRDESPGAAVRAFAMAGGARRRIMWYAYVVRHEKYAIESPRAGDRLVGHASCFL